MPDASREGDPQMPEFQEAIVDLLGGPIVVVKSSYDGFVYVSIPDICKALSLDFDQEEADLEARVELWWGHRQFRVWLPPGRLEDTSCLRSDLISAWLDSAAGRSPSPEKLKSFQRETNNAVCGIFDPSPQASMSGAATVITRVEFGEPPPSDVLRKLMGIDHLAS